MTRGTFVYIDDNIVKSSCEFNGDMYLNGYGALAINTLAHVKQEKDFVKVKRELTAFKIGLKVPSKIRPKRIKGGVLLVDCDYNLR